MGAWLLRLYDKTVLERPWIALILVALVVVLFSLKAPDFKLDASAESLVLENDEDLRYYRGINKKYGTQDFLIITYTPHGDLLSEESLKEIRELSDQLAKLERVQSVVSILDVPLLNSPRVKLSDMGKESRTLETPGIDKDLVRKEFKESPIYKKLLVSEDGDTTAILVNLRRDEKYFSLLRERNDLKEKQWSTGLSLEEKLQLAKVSREFKEYLAYYIEYQGDHVKVVREILDKKKDKADIFLGGMPMITTDIIDFIRSDLSVFGVGVLLFMIISLGFFFRKVLWVVLPLACCLLSVLILVGFLGLKDWRVTVISSNFISILIIITMSIVIHLIVRYGELFAENPQWNQRTLVIETLRHMTLPCFYTAITTIVAFSSLVVSGIRPVIDFGWMMTIGIGISFCLSFILFPAIIVLTKPLASVSSQDLTKTMTQAIADMTIHHGRKVVFVCALVAIVSLIGVMKLQVDNRFIDYFKPSTEIYQGMEVIDTKLGGTTPLDVIIDADQQFYEYLKQIKEEPPDEFEDPFADSFSDEDGKEEEDDSFWFNGDKLKVASTIHDHLEDMPQLGKVISIATLAKVLTHLNDGKLPDDYDLAVIRKILSPELRGTFVEPYLSADGNEIRISTRIEETDPSLNRGELIENINQYLTKELGIEPERIHFTGMAVLYNNMLHSLYRSQILTLGAVFAGILIMFIILFRNVFLSLIAVMPTLLAAALVLGLMGWLGIPLDMMTITIAAITIGIGVDDTIHYIYRFKEEFAINRDYKKDVRVCHGSIGRAIYYTSITVTVGFSILSLSSFIPTIYFGLLTGFAMIVALVNNLTLLPMLIVIFKPLGAESAEPFES